MKKIFAPLVVPVMIGFLGILGALAGAPNANATSVWDNDPITTSDLVLANPSGYSEDWKDKVYDFSQMISSKPFDNNSSVVCDQNAIDSFNAAQANGVRMAVQESTNYGNKNIIVYWAEQPRGLEWVINGNGTREVDIHADGMFDIRMDNNNKPYLNQCYAPRQNAAYGGTGWTSGNTNYYKIFQSSYLFNYPDGYTGSIPVVPDPQGPKPDYTDIVSLSFKVDSKTIYYWDTTHWDGVDKSKIACRYTFAKVGGDVIQDSMGACDGEVKTVSVADFGDYAVQMDVIYDSNHDGFLNPEDPEEIVGSVGRDLKVDGQIYSGTSGNGFNQDNRFVAANCFQDNFPWVNVVGCADVLGQAINLLSFNTIKLNNNYDTGNNCVALGTIGEWLSLPNETVCPIISPTIRSIITPFITLALAMGLIKFVANHKAEDIG